MRDANKTDLSGTPQLSSAAETRRIDPASGDVVIVQPVGTPLQPGNRYYNHLLDAGHLACLHCTAKMKFHEAQPSSGGTSGAGSPAFFKPVKKHDDDCIVPLRPAENRKSPIDRSKGYRVNINTAEYSEIFNQKSGVFDVSAKGRLRLTDEDIRDRESFTVREVGDLVRFIEKADLSRIKPSRVVFQNNAEDWDEFFIRAGTPSRLRSLVERLENHQPGTEPLFAALEVTTTGYHNPQPRLKQGEGGSYYKTPRAPIDSIEIGRDARGKPAFARIDIYIDDKNNTHVSDALLKPDTYLVMGEVRHRSLEHKNSTTHYLSITVTDGRQIMPVNIENIYKAKLEASNRRVKKPPSFEPTPL